MLTLGEFRAATAHLDDGVIVCADYTVSNYDELGCNDPVTQPAPYSAPGYAAQTVDVKAHLVTVLL